MNNQSYGNIYYRASKMGPGPERLTEIPGIDWVGFRQVDGRRRRACGAARRHRGRGRRARSTRRGPYLLDLHTDKTYPTPVGVWRERQQEWEDND